MTKFFFTYCFVFVGVTLLSVSAQAQPTLIHYWNFEQGLFSASWTGKSIQSSSDVSGIDSGWVIWQSLPGVVSDTSILREIGGEYPSGLNQRSPATTYHAVRAQNPSDSMELRWYMPTTGYRNLIFTLDCSKASDGQTTQNFDYSVDNGVTFTSTGLPMTTLATSTSWQLVRLDLRTCTILNNQAMVIFRIRYTGNTKSSGGWTRYDNVTLEGDSIDASAISSPITSNPEYFLFPNPVVAHNHIMLGMPAGVTRSIALFNSGGERVDQFTSDATRIELPLKNLPAGQYYVVVSTIQGQRLSTLSLMKE